MSLGLPDFSVRIRRDRPPQRTGRRAGSWTQADGRERGRSFVDGAFRIIEWDALGVFILQDTSTIVDAWPSSGLADDALLEGFTSDIEPLFLQACGWDVLHASAVGGASGVTAFCGPSGAGKSTLAFALRGDGREQIADDHLVVDMRGDEPMVCLRPFRASLRSASRRYFGEPELATPTPRTVRAPLVNVLLIQQVDDLQQPFEIESVAPARAFTEVLPHAHCFDPDDRSETERLTRHYLNLVAAVDVFRLRYRPSFEEMPRLVAAVSALLVRVEGARR